MKDPSCERSILIIEDEKNIRTIIKLYLEREGFMVIEAKDVKEGKNQFVQHPPCLILLDIRLPDESGFHYCNWLRNEQNSDVPLIMVSAVSSEAETIKALKQGADDFLHKPFNPLELVARVESVLRRSIKK
ncbi:MAG: response regulator transcription factor [Bacillus sp. (in: firmicutes)]